MVAISRVRYGLDSTENPFALQKRKKTMNSILIGQSMFWCYWSYINTIRNPSLVYYFRIKKGYIFLLKLFLLALIFLTGCASNKTVDPYGLEDRLKLSRDYQKSLEEMEENYKEEARRVQGQEPKR